MDSIAIPNRMRVSINQSWNDGHVGNVNHRIEIGDGVLAGDNCILADIVDLSVTAKNEHQYLDNFGTALYPQGKGLSIIYNTSLVEGQMQDVGLYDHNATYGELEYNHRRLSDSLNCVFGSNQSS